MGIVHNALEHQWKTQTQCQRYGNRSMWPCWAEQAVAASRWPRPNKQGWSVLHWPLTSTDLTDSWDIGPGDLWQSASLTLLHALSIWHFHSTSTLDLMPQLSGREQATQLFCGSCLRTKPHLLAIWTRAQSRRDDGNSGLRGARITKNSLESLCPVCHFGLSLHPQLLSENIGASLPYTTY